MIEHTDKETGVSPGSISEQQLQFLIDHLEEESDEDKDYYVNKATLERFATRGADEGRLSVWNRP